MVSPCLLLFLLSSSRGDQHLQVVLESVVRQAHVKQHPKHRGSTHFSLHMPETHSFYSIQDFLQFFGCFDRRVLHSPYSKCSCPILGPWLLFLKFSLSVSCWCEWAKENPKKQSQQLKKSWVDTVVCKWGWVIWLIQQIQSALTENTVRQMYQPYLLIALQLQADGAECASQNWSHNYSAEDVRHLCSIRLQSWRKRQRDDCATAHSQQINAEPELQRGTFKTNLSS